MPLVHAEHEAEAALETCPIAHCSQRAADPFENVPGSHFNVIDDPYGEK